MRMTKTFASITAMALVAGTAFAQDATTETEVQTDAQVQAGETTADGGATLTTEGEVEGGDSLQAESDAETDLNADESMRAEGEADLNADETMQAETDAAPVEGLDPSKLTTEELAGKPVYSTDDERVGEISELVIDTEGEITDVVIEVGGFLGLGEKPVAVKFGELRFEADAAANAGADAAVDGEADTMAATEGDATADPTGIVDASAYRIIVPMTEEELENLPEYEE